jgi:hypothetical protein
MAYPVRLVDRPDDLDNATNGRLPVSSLELLGAAGRPTARAHRQTERSWMALRGEVRARFAEELSLTSSADGYRTYDQQVNAFTGSYVEKYDPVACTLEDQRTWNGRKWYKRRGHSAKASPGTSNHGWGLALDVCLWRNGGIVAITASKPVFSWLLANAGGYGFSWELQSEPWHLRLFTGDNTPAAVLAYETPDVPAPRPPLPQQPAPPIGDDPMPILTRYSDGSIYVVAADFSWRFKVSQDTHDQMVASGRYLVMALTAQEIENIPGKDY